MIKYINYYVGETTSALYSSVQMSIENWKTIAFYAASNGVLKQLRSPIINWVHHLYNLVEITIS